MKTIEQVDKFSHEKFQKTFGVNRVTFATMLSILNKQYEEAHKKGGRPPKGSMFDRLCIFFAHYRDGRTIADIANEYNLADATICDIIHLVEKTLIDDGRFNLPSKRALIKEKPEIVIVDATECEIQRPKKNRKISTPVKRNDTP